MVKKTILPVTVAILSLAGLLFTFALSEEFYYAGLPPVEGVQNPAILTTLSHQVCGAADSFLSCETVSKSKYAKFLGLPLALYGLFFYLLTGLSAVGLWWSDKTIKAVTAAFVFWISTLAVIADIGLLAVSVFVIDALCPICLFTYLVNLLLMIIAFAYLRKTGNGLFRVFRLVRPALAIYAVAGCLMLAAGISAAYGAKTFFMARRTAYLNAFKEVEIVRSVNRFKERPEERISVTPLMVAGPVDAPVTIIEISDFLCPYCAHASTVMDQLIAANPDTLRVLFVNLPLDQACNRFMIRPMHKGSCDLARGAVCAAAQGKLKPYQKVAFETRKNDPSRDDLTAIASSSGLSLPEFTQCMTSRDSLELVLVQIEETRYLNIRGTPTIFINNKRFEGQLYIETLQQIVDMEVARQSKQ